MDAGRKRKQTTGGFSPPSSLPPSFHNSQCRCLKAQQNRNPRSNHPKLILSSAISRKNQNWTQMPDMKSGWKSRWGPAKSLKPATPEATLEFSMGIPTAHSVKTPATYHSQVRWMLQAQTPKSPVGFPEPIENSDVEDTLATFNGFVSLAKKEFGKKGCQHLRFFWRGFPTPTKNDRKSFW